MKRPELETDPAKLPGQIVNRHPDVRLLRDYIQMAEYEEAVGAAFDKAVEQFGAERLAMALVSDCRCTKPAVPCEGCPNA